MSEEQRIRQIIKLLEKEYPESRTALHHKNAIELLVSTILSAQCTDKRVNIVTKRLFQKYKTPEDYARAPIEDLELAVKSTGFYRNKAKSIKTACTMILSDFQGKVPDSMQDLLKLPGVARKTANVVLGSWFGNAEGIVVDTHVKRITNLLGLTQNTNPEKIEQDLMKTIPKEYWILFSHMLIWHGRKVCVARRPRCSQCVLNNLCPSAFKHPAISKR
ncbi:endonuclease III [Candidatus Woesearchaeota archaeon]|nr:endonuclease III [Candidatus Woesearchaeota archaeon]